MKFYVYCRLCQWHNLFLLFFFFISCHTEQKEISIVWKDGKAVGIFIPTKMIKGFRKDAIGNSIVIHNVSDTNATNLLGNLSWKVGNKETLYFEPLIPFTNGMRYSLHVANQKVASFSILSEKKIAPQVITIYPEIDTLPENLLKIYIRFSQPMREGISANAIHIISNRKDTLQNTFLDLQPELWNEDRTVLTLWLDPGRIKRALQPNQRMGNPLKKTLHYEIIIADSWQSEAGIKLEKSFHKTFEVGDRDSMIPKIEEWRIGIPAKNTMDPILFFIPETLDHYLLNESITIINNSNLTIIGKINISKKGALCTFIPTVKWNSGNYQIRIDSKLEDLAGNNLNRPFDRDIKNSKKPSSQKLYFKQFSIAK